MKKNKKERKPVDTTKVSGGVDINPATVKEPKNHPSILLNDVGKPKS